MPIVGVFLLYHSPGDKPLYGGAVGINGKGHGFLIRVKSGAFLRIRVHQRKSRYIVPSGGAFIERFQVGNAILAPACSNGEPLENRLLAVLGMPQPLFDGFAGVKPGVGPSNYYALNGLKMLYSKPF